MLITVVKVSERAKILGLFPVPSKSHMAVNITTVKELADRGHELTAVSQFPAKSEYPNYKNIALDANVLEKYFATQGENELFCTVTVTITEQAHTIIYDAITCQVIIMDIVYGLSFVAKIISIAYTLI